jgi:branched-subunit amino acid aminotransferase/4-amino-4-deoxychorismate lyase
MDSRSEFVMINGELIPSESALIPAQNTGLYHGAGCFETFCSEEDAIFKFDSHVNRLNEGLQYLGLNPSSFLNGDVLRKRISKLLQANGLQRVTAKVRIQVSLADRGGYRVASGLKPVELITAEKPSLQRSDVELAVVSTRVVPAVSKPSHLKLSNMLHYRKAWQEAEEKGADDALMFSVNGYMAETSVANIFWKIGDIIYTPSKECDILPGVMRNSLIEIIGKMDSFKVREGEFTLQDVQKADTCWITNSVMNLKSVSKIDEKRFSSEDTFFDELKSHLSSYIEQHLQ